MITTYATRAEWEASRRGGFPIGASEVASLILGCGPIDDRGDLPPWCDLYDLWRSHQPGYVPQHRAEMDDGNAWEPLALRLYDPPAGFDIIVSPLTVAVHSCGWLRATPDAWIVPAEVFPIANLGRACAGLVEVKTDRHRNAAEVWTATEIREFSDGEPIGMPAHYWLQVQAQLACTGAPWCDVEAWLPGFASMPERRRVRVYPSRRWPAIFAQIEAIRARHFVGGEPPEAWTREQIEDAQRRAYPSPTVERAATAEESGWIADAVEAKAGIARLEAIVDASRSRIAESRGDARRLFCAAGTYTVTTRGIMFRAKGAS